MAKSTRSDGGLGMCSYVNLNIVKLVKTYIILYVITFLTYVLFKKVTAQEGGFHFVMEARGESF